MPRNVRNFWVELEVDGQVTEYAAGPQAKDGGFSLTVKMRDQGEIITALDVWGVASADGSLVLRAYELPNKRSSGAPSEVCVRTER